MSKTLDALKRVSEIRENSADMPGFKNPQTAVHPSVVAAPGIQARNFMPSPASFSPVYNGHSQDRSRQDSRFQNIILMLLAVVGLASLLLSFRTFTEIRKVNAVSSSAIKDLALQKSKIATLETAVAQMNDDAVSKEKALKDKLNKVMIALDQNKEKIEDLSRENKQLRSLTGDLKWSIQSLNEKYMRLNAQVQSTAAQQ